jgi:hypothetical protein
MRAYIFKLIFKYAEIKHNKWSYEKCQILSVKNDHELHFQILIMLNECPRVFFLFKSIYLLKN